MDWRLRSCFQRRPTRGAYAYAPLRPSAPTVTVTCHRPAPPEAFPLNRRHPSTKASTRITPKKRPSWHLAGTCWRLGLSGLSSLLPLCRGTFNGDTRYGQNLCGYCIVTWVSPLLFPAFFTLLKGIGYRLPRFRTLPAARMMQV